MSAPQSASSSATASSSASSSIFGGGLFRPAFRRPSLATTTTQLSPFTAAQPPPPRPPRTSGLPPSYQQQQQQQRSQLVLPTDPYRKCQSTIPVGAMVEEKQGHLTSIRSFDVFLKSNRFLQWIPNDSAHHDQYTAFHQTVPPGTVLPIPFPSQWDTLDGVFNYYLGDTPILSFYYRLVAPQSINVGHDTVALFVHLMRWNGDWDSKEKTLVRLAVVEDIAAPELLGFATLTLQEKQSTRVAGIAVDVLAFPRFSYFLYCIRWRPEFLVSSTPYAVGIHEATYSTNAEVEAAAASGEEHNVKRDVHLITNTLTLIFLPPTLAPSHQPTFVLPAESNLVSIDRSTLPSWLLELEGKS